jgi:hypothetical protein
MTTWIQRSSAEAQAVRAYWRAGRLSSRVVRCANLAAITRLFGSAAQTARHAATRRPGRQIEKLKAALGDLNRKVHRSA